MAIYEYRCEYDGLFEVMRPLGTATPTVDCPSCGAAAGRAISMPSVRTGVRSAWLAAMDHAQKSRHEPDVVTSLPRSGSRRRHAVMTPALQRLPRP
jgi:putative FmdB family regulatory protein